MVRRILPLAWMLSFVCTTALLAKEPGPLSTFPGGLQPLETMAPQLEAVPQETDIVLRLPPVEARPAALPVQWIDSAPAPKPVAQAEPIPPAPEIPEATPVAPLPPVAYSAAAPIGAPPGPPVGPAETYTLDQLRAEMRQLLWTKGEFKIVPYGILWANTAYETSRTFTGDYTFFVFSDDDQGEDAFHVDARATRLGVDILGPRLWPVGCAQTGGRVEIDFQGSLFPENKGTVLLRHAYVEAKDERFRLLAGQTWDVISPLYPGMILYSVGWGGGNIGYRRAQFRAERYFDYSDTMLLALQGSINQNLINSGDCPAGSGVEGDHSGWPVLEGRTALTVGPRGPGFLPWTFGVSGHIGEQSFDFDGVDPADDLTRKTWSFNVDLHMPITERFGFQGEFFTGANLGAYLGGVLQGVNRFTREPIRSTGGWGEVWYFWTPTVHSHVGYGIDDPRDQDITVGRTYNDFIFANLLWNVTPKLLTGFEFTYWETLYKTQSPGESARFEFAVKYGF